MSSFSRNLNSLLVDTFYCYCPSLSIFLYSSPFLYLFTFFLHALGALSDSHALDQVMHRARSQQCSM